MTKQKRKHSKKVGMAPGSLVFTGQQKMQNSNLRFIQYSSEDYQSTAPADLQSVLQNCRDYAGISWLNLDGLHEVETIEKICKSFDLHQLTTEDILSVGQRPKLEEHEKYLFLVLKVLKTKQGEMEVDSEQISFVLMDNVLITFQEQKGDVFEPVRKRIKNSAGYLRRRKADYLLYALLDAVVDNYFLVLEQTGEILEDLETELMENPETDALHKLHLARKEALKIRRSVYPLREVVGHLAKVEPPLLSENLDIFLRDLYDHAVRVIETSEIFRDAASGLLDLYMNSVSNRMNEIMKVLTIIATIFIPLTFIAGIYGMNFEFMPELSWRYGYFVVWGVMLLVLLGMVIYFKRKKWL